MDTSSIDEAMLDAVAPSIEVPPPQNGGNPGLFLIEKPPPSGPRPSIALNGRKTATQSPYPQSPNQSLTATPQRGRGKTEDTNGLITKVTTLLSIESPPLTPPFKRTSSEESEDLKGPRKHRLQLAMLPTGLCYDVRMRFHCEIMPLNSTEDHHPEEPRRIYAIYQELCKAGLVDDPMSTRPLVPQPLLRVLARSATPEEIGLVHDARHYEFVKSLACMLICFNTPYTDPMVNKLTIL